MVCIVPFWEYQNPPARQHRIELHYHIRIKFVSQSTKKWVVEYNYHLNPPTLKGSEYNFFTFNLENFSTVHVNRADAGSSTACASTVFVVSAGAPAKTKACKKKKGLRKKIQNHLFSRQHLNPKSCWGQ